MESMSIDRLPIGWFDMVVVAVIVVGAVRGRTRGMSQEFLPLIKWLTVVGVSGLLYKPLGEVIHSTSVFSLLFSYIVAYLSVALGVLILFIVVKKGIGGKPISSEKFGGSEYYLGAAAGSVRYLCVLVVVLSVLNARLFTQQEVSKVYAYHQDVYGSTFFPTLDSVQRFTFDNSAFGTQLKDRTAFLLIEPTVKKNKDLPRTQWEAP